MTQNLHGLRAELEACHGLPCGTTTGGWSRAPGGNGPGKAVLMIITGVETWTDQLPLTRPYVIATRVVSTVDLHFVRLESNRGFFGLGCAAPTAVTGENVEACLGALDSCAHDILKGSDPRPIRSLTRRLRKDCVQHPSAMAALDMALYDLLAQSMGIPVAAMLGQCVKALPTSITIGILPLEETLSEAREYLGRGFSCLKVKTRD